MYDVTPYMLSLHIQLFPQKVLTGSLTLGWAALWRRLPGLKCSDLSLKLFERSCFYTITVLTFSSKVHTSIQSEAYLSLLVQLQSYYQYASSSWCRGKSCQERDELFKVEGQSCYALLRGRPRLRRFLPACIIYIH